MVNSNYKTEKMNLLAQNVTFPGLRTTNDSSGLGALIRYIADAEMRLRAAVDVLGSRLEPLTLSQPSKISSELGEARPTYSVLVEQMLANVSSINAQTERIERLIDILDI